MKLASTPKPLYCSECGEKLEDTGYLPATEHAEEYQPLADAGVCGECGFNEIGMMGCAPELADVIDADAADVLLYVRRINEGMEVKSTKE